MAFGGGYEARLEQNSGGGLSIILIYAFVPSSVVFFLRNHVKYDLFWLQPWLFSVGLFITT